MYPIGLGALLGEISMATYTITGSVANFDQGRKSLG